MTKYLFSLKCVDWVELLVTFQYIQFTLDMATGGQMSSFELFGGSEVQPRTGLRDQKCKPERGFP